MSLPGDLGTVVLTGKFLDPAGNPMRGTVTITPAATLTDATGNVIIPQLQRAYQLFNGTFTTSPLVGTDNSDINPSGWTYLIQIALQEVPAYSFSVALPSSGSPVDLSTLSPAQSIPELAGSLPVTGGTLTGKLTLTGSTPLQIPAGATAGDVLTSDASGNASWSSVAADGIATAAALTAETSRAETAEALKAPLASPALTGSPTAPTKTALTSNTDIATTAYADSAVGVETTRAEAAEAARLPLAGGSMTGPAGFAGQPVLSALTFGVLTSNSDNTAALNTWLSACNTAGVTGWLDAGTYTFTGQISAEGATKLTVKGPGGYLAAGGAILQYSGAAGATTVSAGASVTSATTTLAVTSTGALLGSGTAVVETSLGNQTIAYTGAAGGSLTGVTGFATATIASTAKVWNPVVNLRRTTQLTWDGVGITYTSASCTGTLLDLSGNSVKTANNHAVSRCFLGSLTQTTATLASVSNSYAMAFDKVRFYGANIGVEGYSGSSGAGPSFNFANGVTFGECYHNQIASYLIHNPGTGWTFTGHVGEPNPSGAGNFIFCDTQADSSVTVTGGWLGDTLSGSAIVFQGWSLNLLGSYFTNTAGSIIQLNGTTGSVCVKGGYYKTASPYAVLDANSQTVSSVTIDGAGYFAGTTPMINPSGVLSYLTDAGAGTLAISNISTSSLQVPANGGTNLMTSAMALPTGTTGWVGSNAAITYVAAPGLASGSLKFIATAAAVGPNFVPNGSSFRVAVTAGLTYTALAFGQATTSTAGTWDIIFFWYNSGGTNISTSATTGINLTASAWTEMSVTAAAPATAVAAGLQVKWAPPGSSATTDPFYFCQFSVAQGSSAVWTAPGSSPVVSMAASGLSAGGQAVTSAAQGVAGSDLATVSQLPSATSPVPVSSGGTLNSTLTAYAPLAGGITSTGALQQCTTGLGTSGNVLTSTGSSSLPTFQAPVTGVTLDSTATDIQPPGTQSAGSNAQASKADHVHPLPSTWVPEDFSLLGWSHDPIANGAFGLLINGQTAFAAVPVRYARTITNLVVFIFAAGGSLTTGNFLALYNASGTQVATSADLTAGAKFTTTGQCVVPLTGTYAAVAGIYYVAVMTNSSSTSTLKLAGLSVATSTPNEVTPKRYGAYTTTGTALPGSVTISSLSTPTNVYNWAGIS